MWEIEPRTLRLPVFALRRMLYPVIWFEYQTILAHRMWKLLLILGLVLVRMKARGSSS
jgi:hypothetical protein